MLEVFFDPNLCLKSAWNKQTNKQINNMFSMLEVMFDPNLCLKSAWNKQTNKQTSKQINK